MYYKDYTGKGFCKTILAIFYFITFLPSTHLNIIVILMFKSTNHIITQSAHGVKGHVVIRNHYNGGNTYTTLNLLLWEVQ